MMRDPPAMRGKLRRRSGLNFALTTSEACWDLFPRDWAASALPCGSPLLAEGCGLVLTEMFRFGLRYDVVLVMLLY